MGLRILSTSADLDLVRYAAVPYVSLDQARMTNVLPDNLITSPSFGGRAEAIVIRAVGVDWSAILQMADTATQYAGGDKVMAQAAILDAAVAYTCYYLVPVLQQIVLIEERPMPLERKRQLDWGSIQQSYLDGARTAMDLLLTSSLVTVTPLVLAHPTISPVDPQQADQTTPQLADAKIPTEEVLAIGPGVPF